MMDESESFCSAPGIAEDGPATERMDAEDPLAPDW
jgi:hypothetical protein